jgi:hypothetical protein
VLVVPAGTAAPAAAAAAGQWSGEPGAAVAATPRQSQSLQDPPPTGLVQHRIHAVAAAAVDSVEDSAVDAEAVDR